jgi:hypothetical protein
LKAGACWPSAAFWPLVPIRLASRAAFFRVDLRWSDIMEDKMTCNLFNTFC